MNEWMNKSASTSSSTSSSTTGSILKKLHRYTAQHIKTTSKAKTPMGKSIRSLSLSLYTYHIALNKFDLHFQLFCLVHLFWFHECNQCAVRTVPFSILICRLFFFQFKTLSASQRWWKNVGYGRMCSFIFFGLVSFPLDASNGLPFCQNHEFLPFFINSNRKITQNDMQFHPRWFQNQGIKY